MKDGAAEGRLANQFILSIIQQRRGSDVKEDGGDKPRRNVSWQDKGNTNKGLNPSVLHQLWPRAASGAPFTSDANTVPQSSDLISWRRSSWGTLMLMKLQSVSVA